MWISISVSESGIILFIILRVFHVLIWFEGRSLKIVDFHAGKISRKGINSRENNNVVVTRNCRADYHSRLSELKNHCDRLQWSFWFLFGYEAVQQ